LNELHLGDWENSVAFMDWPLLLECRHCWAWEEGRGLTVSPAKEPGWWVVAGIHRQAIARLDKEVGQDAF
jgi:hypothetical protein